MRITDVRAICTAPAGLALVVVKVETSTPGLHGLGCATFRQRPLTVVTAVNDYLRPFLVGKDPSAIEDIWQSAYVSSYWRSGPVLNNALAGVDAALWEHKGQVRKPAPVPALWRQMPGLCPALYRRRRRRCARGGRVRARVYGTGVPLRQMFNVGAGIGDLQCR